MKNGQFGLFYWTLFLITAPIASEKTSWDYLPIVSFGSRIECETALVQQRNTLATQLGYEERFLRCVKTDEIAPQTVFPVPDY